MEGNLLDYFSRLAMLAESSSIRFKRKLNSSHWAKVVSSLVICIGSLESSTPSSSFIVTSSQNVEVVRFRGVCDRDLSGWRCHECHDDDTADRIGESSLDGVKFIALTSRSKALREARN